MPAAGAFALALLQRPGLASSDTKIDLHVDPVGFLADVASAWSASGGLGQVQAGQYGGYLFPMGPFFALGHELGLGAWVVQRLWLGTLLALAAWGTVRLLDALRPEEPRGAAHLVAGALVVLNPYVIVFANRTSVTLLGYAALPWLLLAVHRGLRDPRGWWWPAAFALVVTATGGGVNAAVTAWLLLGPLLLAGYELLAGGVAWRDARAFTWRTAALSLVASLWWIGPVLAHATYGINFLEFTEQPGSIWATTSITESLRLMGYWLSYLGVGYGDALTPYFSDSRLLLFQPLVVAASLLVPALALAGFAWTRRWRYGPFFLLLALAGLLLMVAGFPEGTPLRRGLTFTYNHVEAVQFLRTTYKAGPLLAIALACLGGAAFAELWQRLRATPPLRTAAAAAAAALVALAAWPLVRGRALDDQVLWERIPAAWTAAAADLDRDLPPNERALVLPAQAFAFYRWGATVDPILPALTDRPVGVRNVPPYADLHSIDLLWSTDSLIQQQRLLPRQLRPLAELMGAGAVVTATDDDADRSGAADPADVAQLLRRQEDFESADGFYGPFRRFPQPVAGELAPPAVLAEVRRYEVAGGPGIVRVLPAGPATIVDGSADALTGLAAFGSLPRDRPLFYAGDGSAEQIRRAAAAGASLVISDSNRRRVFVASRLRQNVGATLSASDPLSEDAAVLDPFRRGADGQTVAVYDGARYVRAPFSPGFAQFPEQRPYAAFDGDRRTFWAADPALEASRHWVELGFARPREVPYVDVLTHRDPRAVVTEVEAGGRRFDVRPGWNRLRVGLRGARSLHVRVASTRKPEEATDSAGGFDEIRVPGLRVRELLRPPRLAESALAGRDLRRSSLTYLFERTTGDDPFRRGSVPPPVRVVEGGGRAEAEAEQVREAGDAETSISRAIDPPVAREFRADAWVSVAPDARDDALDRLAGYRGRARFTSSSRYQGRAGYRASGAFEGTSGRSWVGTWSPERKPWIAWRLPAAVTLRRFALEPSPLPARVPTRVRLRFEGGATGPLEVGDGGLVELTRPARGRDFRLDVLDARFPAGTGERDRRRRSVAVGELRAPELRPVDVPSFGPLRARCGDPLVSAGGRSVRLEVRSGVLELDRGRPLRAVSCEELPLAAGPKRLIAEGRLFRPYLLRLRSPAPAGPAPESGGGSVVDPGSAGRGRHDGVEVSLSGSSYVVLGESYNRGWRAWCGGESLGEPRVIDGFANGWLAGRGCRKLRFEFGPNAWLPWLYGVSGLACLALLWLVAFRRPRAAAPEPPPDLPAADRPPRWRLRRALAAGLVAGAVLGFVFALRAGVVIGPAVALILWWGIGARVLTLAAGALLALVVPLIYLLFMPDGRRGYDTDYSNDLLGAHWVGVAAFVLLALALWRTLSEHLSTARARSDGRADARAAAAGPESPP